METGFKSCPRYLGHSHFVSALFICPLPCQFWRYNRNLADVQLQDAIIHSLGIRSLRPGISFIVCTGFCEVRRHSWLYGFFSGRIVTVKSILVVHRIEKAAR